MRLARASIALAAVVGVFGLVLTWKAVGQSAAVPGVGPYPPVFGVTTQNGGDPERDKLINSEAEIDRTVYKLMVEYKATDKEEERGKIKTKLASALSKLFDVQQKRRELELSRLEAKLKKVRALMKKRDEERKVIIDNRLNQLVREAEGLGWAPPPGPRSSGLIGTSANFKPAGR